LSEMERDRLTVLRDPRLVPVQRLCFISLVVLLVAASSTQADQTDDFVRAAIQKERIPGLSLVVLKDGQIVKVAGYGVADRMRKIDATPDTVYKIGSVSKQFIATGIMLLVQEGRLDLEQPIGRYMS